MELEVEDKGGGGRFSLGKAWYSLGGSLSAKVGRECWLPSLSLAESLDWLGAACIAGGLLGYTDWFIPEVLCVDEGLKVVPPLLLHISLCLCFSLAYSVCGVRGGGRNLSTGVVVVGVWPGGQGRMPPRLSQG